MMFRLIFLFAASVTFHVASIASDNEANEIAIECHDQEVLSPEDAVNGFRDEYCCMVGRVSKDACLKCAKGTVECTESCYAWCADGLCPWRYEDKKERTKCIREGLDCVSCCCGITSGALCLVGGIVSLVTTLACGAESVAATMACAATKCVSCCTATSFCLKPDSVCPVAYCCEKCFHTEKFDSFSNNSKMRNPLEVNNENKAK